MDNKSQFAQWLRDIADHIEEGSPLIHDVETENEESDGRPVKVIRITFNRPEQNS